MDKVISLLFKMTLIPRWGDHSPKFKDSSASHSFRVAIIALIMSRLEKDYEVDEEVVLLKSLFHDLNEVYTGPIRYHTKNNPELKDLLYKLEVENSKEVLKSFPDNLTALFDGYVINYGGDSIEGQIVKMANTLDSILFCKRECDEGGNSKFFCDVYEELKEQYYPNKMNSFNTLLEGLEDRESGIHKLLNAILNMDRIDRWSGKYNHIRDDVASHTFRMASLLVLLLKDLEMNTGQKNDLVSIVSKTLLHDLPETIGGDVKGPMKEKNDDLKDAFELFEKELSEVILSWFPSEIRESFRDPLINAKDDTTEGIYVDIGDKLDAIIKSLLELSYGNPEYKETYFSQLNKIRKLYSDYTVVNSFLIGPLHNLYYNNFK